MSYSFNRWLLFTYANKIEYYNKFYVILMYDLISYLVSMLMPVKTCI